MRRLTRDRTAETISRETQLSDGDQPTTSKNGNLIRLTSPINTHLAIRVTIHTYMPKRGSYHSTTATSVRGSHGQTTHRAPPEAADGRKTRRGGRSRQGTPRQSRIGWIVSRTTSKRSEPQTALRWTTGSHSELTEPYGPLRRRWTMGRRGTRGCCRERKSSWPPGTRKKRRPADDVRPNGTLVILSPPHICR